MCSAYRILINLKENYVGVASFYVSTQSHLIKLYVIKFYLCNVIQVVYREEGSLEGVESVERLAFIAKSMN